MQIIDNFLTTQEHLSILNTLIDVKFDWHFNKNVVYHDRTNSSLNDFQFTHVFYRDNNPTSHYYPILSPILKRLKCDVLVRAKANLRTPTSTIEESDMHIDIAYPTILNKPEVMNAMKTAIYYLNTNDGYTVFENGEKINSVENRIVIFPTQLQHAGSTHTNSKYRIVINFNFF